MDLLISKTDLSKKHEYIKMFNVRFYLTIGFAFLIPLSFLIIILLDQDPNFNSGILFFPFILFTGMFIFLKWRTTLYIKHYLNSEFELSNDNLKLFINGVKKKEIIFKSPITLKTTKNGTYVLVGKYSWAQLNMSKHPPQKIPTRSSDIFIPSITEKYEDIIKKLAEVERTQN